MSWSHQTVGWDKFEAFVLALRKAGIVVLEEEKAEVLTRGFDLDDRKAHLRIAYFKTKRGKRMVVEEWLQVEDRDCDGTSVVDIAIYAYGRRPSLVTEILDPC